MVTSLSDTGDVKMRGSQCHSHIPQKRNVVTDFLRIPINYVFARRFKTSIKRPPENKEYIFLSSDIGDQADERGPLLPVHCQVIISIPTSPAWPGHCQHHQYYLKQ